MEAAGSDVGAIALQAGVVVTELREVERGDLEDLFFTLTDGEPLEAAA